MRYPHELAAGTFHTFTRSAGQRRNIPEFIYNHQQTRHVLAVRAWRFMNNERPVPPDVVKQWEQLDLLATTRIRYANHSRPNADHGRYSSALLFCETYLTGQVAIAYAAWRMQMPTPELAREYGISQRSIRAMLERLVEVANILGYPTGRKTKPRRQRKPAIIRQGLRKANATPEEWEAAKQYWREQGAKRRQRAA